MDENCPTLTYNLIGRHQSSYVTTRVASVQSPWMLQSQVGDLHTIPISTARAASWPRPASSQT